MMRPEFVSIVQFAVKASDLGVAVEAFTADWIHRDGATGATFLTTEITEGPNFD
jgi:hypothetical protein